MSNLYFSSSNYLIKLIDAVLDTNIHIHGKEHLNVDAPILFVSNHFTRFETFIMPYVIYSHAKLAVRSLADYSIFVGYFGRYLTKVGTLSTLAEHRDEIIIGDLMSGRENWMIYPEGAMVKNKKVLHNGEFILDFLDGKSKMHTGSAVLAMRAQLLKQEYLLAQKKGDLSKIKEMNETFFIKEGEVSSKNIVVVPVNITYVPIRPGKNPFMGAGSRFVKTIDERIKEELEIEGNILLDAEIHICFDKAIDISEYLLHAKKELACQEGVCKNVSDQDLISYKRNELTTQFMDNVYKNTMIHFDHIFSLVLEFHTKAFIGLRELKRAIFLSARDVVGLKVYKVHHSITDELYKILTYEEDPWLSSALGLAMEQGILEKVEDELYKINKKKYKDEHHFHTVRLKNTFRVIFNEVALFENIKQSVQTNLKKSPEKIKEEVFHVIYNRDKKRYLKDYNRFYSVIFSKPKEIGEPFVLYNPKYTTGIVLSHGYKSSPSEIRALADFLFDRGINVYGVRLQGHGTVSEDLRDCTWEMWYDSFNRGFAAMRQVNKHLFLAGFSTGGLLAILATKRKLNKLDGLIVINAALELQDIRVDYVVPTIHKLNTFLSLFNADLEYVEGEAEFPEFNYKRNYIKSLEQLRLLMKQSKDALSSIRVPTLIVQAKNDPVVKPQSAQEIFETIGSEDKVLTYLEASRHVIVLGEGREKVFNEVFSFIDRLLKKKKI